MVESQLRMITALIQDWCQLGLAKETFRIQSLHWSAWRLIQKQEHMDNRISTSTYECGGTMWEENLSSCGFMASLCAELFITSINSLFLEEQTADRFSKLRTIFQTRIEIRRLACSITGGKTVSINAKQIYLRQHLRKSRISKFSFSYTVWLTVVICVSETDRIKRYRQKVSERSTHPSFALRLISSCVWRL